MKPTLLVPLMTLYIQCTPPEEPELRESFSFTGVIRECKTEKPIAGALVIVKASTDNFFAGYPNEPEITYTDANGFFSLRPLKDNTTDWYDIYFGDDNHWGNYIYFDINDIRKKNQDTIYIDKRLSPYGYLKLILNNVNLYDATDSLFMDPKSFFGGCGSYGLEQVYSSLGIEPYFAGAYHVVGIVNNGIFLFRVTGNDSTRIFYNVKRNGIRTSNQERWIYCPANDTTVINIDY